MSRELAEKLYNDPASHAIYRAGVFAKSAKALGWQVTISNYANSICVVCFVEENPAKRIEFDIDNTFKVTTRFCGYNQDIEEANNDINAILNKSQENNQVFYESEDRNVFNNMTFKPQKQQIAKG